MSEIVFTETPVDYQDGSIEIYIEESEDCADITIRHTTEGAIGLRLDRDELAELIATAARAMAVLIKEAGA